MPPSVLLLQPASVLSLSSLPISIHRQPLCSSSSRLVFYFSLLLPCSVAFPQPSVLVQSRPLFTYLCISASFPLCNSSLSAGPCTPESTLPSAQCISSSALHLLVPYPTLLFLSLKCFSLNPFKCISSAFRKHTWVRYEFRIFYFNSLVFKGCVYFSVNDLYALLLMSLTTL